MGRIDLRMRLGGDEPSDIDSIHMIGESELLKLMSDLESDRVERAISTNDTTKFRSDLFFCK
jgi:hypothetical protein